jgi:hypothetical protein
MSNVQLFLPWEVALYLTLLQKPLTILFPDITSNIETYKAIIAFQFPVTVDQFRQQLQLPPHPDGNNAPGRGAIFVYQPDPGVQAGDNTIPDEILIASWDGVVTANNQLQTGQLTHSQLVAQYQTLYNLASIAATNLNVQLL